MHFSIKKSCWNPDLYTLYYPGTDRIFCDTSVSRLIDLERLLDEYLRESGISKAEYDSMSENTKLDILKQILMIETH